MPNLEQPMPGEPLGTVLYPDPSWHKDVAEAKQLLEQFRLKLRPIADRSPFIQQAVAHSEHVSRWLDWSTEPRPGGDSPDSNAG